jgi:hypothetical protein
MRYGNANAGGGPDVDEPFSPSCDFGEAEASPVDEKEVPAIGGGSMSELAEVNRAGRAGSGKDGIVSSAEDVSTVINFVGLEVLR